MFYYTYDNIIPTVIIICSIFKLLVENSEALDDLQFNPTQIDVLTNVVGALAETAKIQVTQIYNTAGFVYDIMNIFFIHINLNFIKFYDFLFYAAVFIFL